MNKFKILAVLIVISVVLKAQQFSFGSEVGFISSINTDYEFADFDNRRNTYYSGLNINFKYDENLTFSTGLHYLRQGYRHSTCYMYEKGIKNELVGKIDYIIVPFTFNFNFGELKRFITSFGIYGAYNIKAVQDYPKPIGGCAIGYIEDLTDYIQKYSIGGILGIGYKIFENDNFQIYPMIKYYQGLNNTVKNPFPNLNFHLDRKYSSVLILMTFNYKFKR